MSQEDIFVLIDKFCKDNNIQQLERVHVANIAGIKTHKDNLIPILSFLINAPELRFTVLTDLFAADFPSRTRRFEVVYNLLSLEYNRRLLIKLEVMDDEEVPTITQIFKAAGWYEREVYDMYGIKFAGNLDMRRILTDYGFVGYPLRKDFPLSGHLQVKYDEELQKVIYEPVSLEQEFRSFDFTSPWQGPNILLPGDEKASK